MSGGVGDNKDQSVVFNQSISSAITAQSSKPAMNRNLGGGRRRCQGGNTGNTGNRDGRKAGH